MHRRNQLLFVLIFGLFMTCHAEGKSLAGVWKGTIGRMAVTACFNNGSSKGNYYYQKYLVPIGLTTDGPVLEGTTPKRWREDEVGLWTIDKVTDAEILGEWAGSDPSKRLPLHLHRVTTVNSHEAFDPVGQACWSDAFNSPLPEPWAPIPGPVHEVNGLRYRELSIGLSDSGKKPAIIRGLAARNADFHINTIEFLGSTPAIDSINQTLNTMIPLDYDAVRDMISFRQEIMESGTGGAYIKEIQRIEFVAHWLCLTVHEGASGGPWVPNSSEYPYIVDLKTGKQEDLNDWFDKESWEGEDAGEQDGNVPPIVYAKMDQNDLKECLGPVEPKRITQHGIWFVLPVMQGSCGFGVEIPFKELAPYLSNKGRASIAEISAAALNK